MKRQIALSAFLALGCFLLAPRLFAAPAPVVMGFSPAENVESTEMNGKRFAEYFKKKTGLTVKMFIATDYTALVEALRSNQVDFAWLPPVSYVKAEEVANAVLLLKSIRQGVPSFYGCLITRTDRGLKKLDDLKGKTVAWVDPVSSSGHLIPKAELITKHHLDPDKFFKRQVFAGGHDAVVLAVLNGTVDAGATFSDAKGIDGAWNQFLKNPDDKKKIQAIYITDPIPPDTLSTSKKFAAAHPDIVKKTTDLLVAMGKDQEGRDILKALYRIDSMVPAEPKDYEPIRAAARVLKIN